MQSESVSPFLISPSGEAFTSPLFLLFAVITQGQKIASSEKNPNVTYALPEKSALTSETALGCNDLGVEYCDRPLDLWISPDPAREFASPYTYVGNNPINKIDPNGESTVEAGGSGSISLGLVHFNLSLSFAMDPEAAMNRDWGNTLFVKGAAGASAGPGFGTSARLKLGLSSESPEIGRATNTFREVVAGVGIVGGWKESADKNGNKSLDISLGVGKELSGSVGVETVDTKSFGGMIKEFFTGKNEEH